MQSEKERRALLERYGREETRPLFAVVKCAIGLAALCAIAAAPWLLAGSGGAGAPSATIAQPLPTSMAESKRIFDDRRQYYETRTAGTESTQGAALTRELHSKTEGAAPRGRALAP